MAVSTMTGLLALKPDPDAAEVSGINVDLVLSVLRIVRRRQPLAGLRDKLAGDFRQDAIRRCH